MRHGMKRVSGPVVCLFVAGALFSCSRQAPPEPAPTPHARRGRRWRGTKHLRAGAVATDGAAASLRQLQSAAQSVLRRPPRPHHLLLRCRVGGRSHRPLDAYNFAKGQPIPLPPYDAQGRPLRTAQLARALDFTAITRQFQLFGETTLCLDPKSSAYNDPTCVTFRTTIPQMTEASIGRHRRPRRSLHRILGFPRPRRDSSSAIQTTTRPRRWTPDLSRACLCDLGGYPARRRAVLRHRRLRLHDLRRLRMERPAGRQQPAPQRHLPQRRRAGAADQLHGAADAAGPVGRARARSACNGAAPAATCWRSRTTPTLSGGLMFAPVNADRQPAHRRRRPRRCAPRWSRWSR